MNDYEMIKAKLSEGMHKGNMHNCLRDIGRLAGGCVATGRITEAEADELGRYAESLAINPKEAEAKWREAIGNGRESPAEREMEYIGTEREITFDTVFSDKDFHLVDAKWLEKQDVSAPADWDGKAEMLEYLGAMFKPEEFVGYALWNGDGEPKPNVRVFGWTCGQITDRISKGDFDAGINSDAGAWVILNPLDGTGQKDGNVTAFRYALLECDEDEIGKQVAIYRKLELPCKFIIHSGGKSAHAVVKINADSEAEFRKRVDFLYDICRKNGLAVDNANRNPSRLSRLPGAMRGGKPQYIISRECGKKTWEEWYDYINDVNDDLPEIQDATLAADEKLPALADELIAGILRQSHKMRVTGPSKAGKSFLLLELAIAISEGVEWLGRQCRQGSVLYVNLELDGASCFHRIHDIYEAMGITPKHRDMLKVWNLRGHSMPLDKLAPKIIRRCEKMGLAAIIIDPIYKVLTGDENAADDMAKFCNYFDCIAVNCKTSVIDCHHHSKGSQSGKRSMDRGSGSGVFARDPDALLDMIELDGKTALTAKRNNEECEAMRAVLDKLAPDWRTKIPIDSAIVADKLMCNVEQNLPEVAKEVRDARAKVPKSTASAWRVESTLREFAAIEAINIWFDYPVHKNAVELTDARPLDEIAPWENRKRDTPKKPDVATATKNALDEFFQDKDHRSISVADLVEKVKEMTGGKGEPRSVKAVIDKEKYKCSKDVVFML